MDKGHDKPIFYWLSYDNFYNTTLQDSATCVVVHHPCVSYNYINASSCFKNAVVLLVLWYRDLKHTRKWFWKKCQSTACPSAWASWFCPMLQYFGLSFSSANWLHGLRRAMEPAKWIVKAQAWKLLLLSYQFCKGFAWHIAWYFVSSSQWVWIGKAGCVDCRSHSEYIWISGWGWDEEQQRS